MSKRAVSAVVLSALLCAAQAPSPAAANDPAAATPVVGQLSTRPINGAAAVAGLGQRLPQVAQRHGLSAPGLRRLLESDPAIWADQQGRLFAKDPLPAAADTTGSSTAGAALPDAQTFTLHSRPGSTKTIYLDFTGETVTDTTWNTVYQLPTTAQPAFDLDGNPGTWSPAEHAVIQSVWQRVVEDYAPFDVDVTTEDPGVPALERSALEDNTFGLRVLITPSTDAASRFCGNTCGGAAYIDVFDNVFNVDDQPAWVFSHLLDNDAKNIAEAVSHEAGHTLGLFHDGTSTSGYYFGHGAWAPIMGAGYARPIVQWSAGEYTDANNQQDDLAVIASNGLALRPDDHANAPGATATALPTGPSSVTGVIGTRSDVDVFAFDRANACSTTVSVNGAPGSSNLDPKLRLLNSSGAEIGSDDPVSGYLGIDSATGLGAGLTRVLPAGRYYAEISGVGALTPATGYSDYGSLGQYALSLDACDGLPSVTATSPAAGATEVALASDVTATFSEPVTGVDATSFTLRTPAGTAVPATISYDPTTRVATLNPTTDLARNTNYTATVSAGVKDADGNPVTATSWSFSTLSDVTAPTVTARTPAPGATGVAWASDITATFSEPVTGLDATSFTLRTPAGATVPATISYDPTTRVATLNPTTDLTRNTSYTATVSAGVRDLADNPLTSTSWTFTTFVGDITAPTVTARTPAPGATGFARTGNVRVGFSETVTGVSTSTFVLRKTGTSTPIAATVTWNATSGRWVLNPSVTLAARTSYTVTVTGGPAAIRDAAGNPLTTGTWTFMTGS